MKFKEFLEEVKRTIPDLDERHSINQYHLDRTKQEGESTALAFPKDLVNTAHCRLGIFSEINEIMDALKKVPMDKVNVQEELCDLLWYVANDINTKIKRTAIGAVINGFHDYEFGKNVRVSDGGWTEKGESVLLWFHCIVYNASKLANLNKRDLAYGEEEEAIPYVAITIYLLNAVNNIAYELGIDLEDGMEKNIAKLRKRYPDKFSNEKALNRDLDQERKALEGLPTDLPVGHIDSNAMEGSASPQPKPAQE